MDEPKPVDAEFLERVLIEAIRLGAMPVTAVEKAQQHFDHLARLYQGSSAAERYETLSAMADQVMLDVQAPSVGDFHAAQRRKQMRLRAEHGAGDPP